MGEKREISQKKTSRFRTVDKAAGRHRKEAEKENEEIA